MFLVDYRKPYLFEHTLKINLLQTKDLLQLPSFFLPTELSIYLRQFFSSKNKTHFVKEFFWQDINIDYHLVSSLPNFLFVLEIYLPRNLDRHNGQK
jgi:hypothetical protein